MTKSELICGGKLDRKITIQNRTTSTNALGEKTDTWATYATMWANFRTMGGKEGQGERQEVAELTNEFRIRYIPEIVPDMRILFEGTYYDIQSVSEIQRKRYLSIKATSTDNV
jgi:SPP1 family predicted phage head-tail adaptor